MANSGTLTGARLYESHGRISETIILLTPDAAASLETTLLLH